MDHRERQPISRRDALCRIGNGFGMLAFAGLVGESLGVAEALAAQAATFPNGGLHHAARAKHVIFLFMNGGPSHVDTFDPKPDLASHAGQEAPATLKLKRRKTGKLMASPFKFQKYGQSGIEVSELFPQVAGCIDDICVLRSMHTDIPNHEPALLMMNSGQIQPTRPCRAA